MHPIDRLFRFVLPLGGIAVLGTVLAVGWLAQPDRFAKGYAPEQPIPFSHQLHAGTLKIACAYCHSGATRPSHALTSLGHSEEEARSALRVSLLPGTRPEAVEALLAALRRILKVPSMG